jgi:hypothetical protein
VVAPETVSAVHRQFQPSSGVRFGSSAAASRARRPSRPWTRMKTRCGWACRPPWFPAHPPGRGRPPCFHHGNAAASVRGRLEVLEEVGSLLGGPFLEHGVGRSRRSRRVAEPVPVRRRARPPGGGDMRPCCRSIFLLGRRRRRRLLLVGGEGGRA